MGKGRITTRLRYPDEKKYHWLPILLDAYHILDEGLKKHLKSVGAARHEKIACKKGCFECCLRSAIDLTDLEYRGISWWVGEQLRGQVRAKTRENLLNRHRTTACPFLVEGCCAVYPVRPLTCRIFYVYGEPCGRDEDVGRTRPQDICPPDRESVERSAMRFLDFYGIKTERDKLIAFYGGYIQKIGVFLHDANLDGLLKVMATIDKVKSMY